MGSIDAENLDIPAWQRKRSAEGSDSSTPTPANAEVENPYDIPAFLRKQVN
jgi:hypothetical protein